MKRSVLLMLVLILMMTFVGSACAAETADNGLKGALGAELLEKAKLPADQPYLALYVEYEKTGEYCTTHARATLEYINPTGEGDHPAAQDVVIELKTEDTLELIEGSSYHVFYDELPCGGKYTFEFDLYCEFPMEKVEKAPEPKLTVSVKSSNVGGCEYTCLFDSMTEPRALVYGWETGDTAPNAIRNDVAMMAELFDKSYYNMQPVETDSQFNHSDIWALLGQLPAKKIDHNDVTYIYINAHGPTYGDEALIFPGFQAFAPDTVVTFNNERIVNKDLVLYKEFFEYIKQNVKGKVVYVFDICFSGTAISRAEDVAYEDDRLSLVTSVDAFSAGGAYDNWLSSDYGWFTKELYEEFVGRTGEQTVGDVYSYMRHHADMTIQLGPYATINPQFTGNSDTVMFCYDPDAWIEDPEFVVVEETLVPSMPAEIIVTTEIEDNEDQWVSSYIVRPFVHLPGSQEAADAINRRLEEAYKNAQKVIEDYRLTSLDKYGNKHSVSLTISDISTSGSLLFITFEESRFTSGAARPMGWKTALSFDTVTGGEVEMTDILPSDKQATDALTDLIEEKLREKYKKDLMTDIRTAAVYATTKSQVTWSMAVDGIHVVYPADWIAPRFVGNLEIVLPYEELNGILDEKYLPSAPAVQGSIEIVSGAEEADFGEAGAHTLRTEGSAANVKVSVIYGSASYSYPRTMVFYASALYDQSAVLPDFPEGEWLEASFESGGSIEELRFDENA